MNIFDTVDIVKEKIVTPQEEMKLKKKNIFPCVGEMTIYHKTDRKDYK